MMKKIWKSIQKLDPNFLIAISAVVISLCALLVSLQEVRIMRQQQKASMYPYLTVSRSYSAEGFSVSVKNSGSGLARINSVELRNEQQYFKNWLEVIETYLPDSLAFGYDMLRTNNLNDQILTQNEEVEVFAVKWTPATRLLEELTRDLNLVVCYSSLLNDYWLLDDGEQYPISAPCKVVKDRQFY